MLASDKTTLTQHQGNKNCYAVYLSSANIDKSVRSKGLSRCWLMVGQIPVARWHDVKNETVLTRRLYHVCMDIITKNLKAASHEPVMMVDARGTMAKKSAPSYSRISPTSQSSTSLLALFNRPAPSSLAQFDSFGRAKAHRLRHGSYTMGLISHIIRVKRVKPENLGKFRNASKFLFLNGRMSHSGEIGNLRTRVNFSLPDALHQWHKFFWMHPVNLGENTYDRRRNGPTIRFAAENSRKASFSRRLLSLWAVKSPCESNATLLLTSSVFSPAASL